jgi:hypothetical protein
MPAGTIVWVTFNSTYLSVPNSRACPPFKLQVHSLTRWRRPSYGSVKHYKLSFMIQMTLGPSQCPEIAFWAIEVNSFTTRLASFHSPYWVVVTVLTTTGRYTILVFHIVDSSGNSVFPIRNSCVTRAKDGLFSTFPRFFVPCTGQGVFTAITFWNDHVLMHVMR